MIQTEFQDRVAVVKLNRGTTNALTLPLITELSETLHSLICDPCIEGLVLTSSNEKFFCIGYDVKELYNVSKKDFTAFYTAFNRFCLDLYTAPKPTVAAVTGHAIAGGCALTLCCDYRFIAEGKKLMGFNVVKLGIPVPYLVNCILLHMVGAKTTRDIVDSGEFYLPEQLLSMGMVDCVVPVEEVIPKAIEKAHELGALPHKAYTVIKGNRVEPVEKQILQHLKEKEQFFIECWFSDEARTLIKEAMEKF